MPATPKKTQKDRQNKTNNQNKAAVKPVPSSAKAKTPAGPAAPRHFRGLNYLTNAWIFIPAIFYFILVGQYATNAPIKDDYDAILDFLYNFNQAHSLGVKAALLFSQHNEHRILSTRLLTVLYYFIAGKVNFRNLIFIGNLQLVVVFLVSVHFIRRCLPKYWNFVAFVWGLCLFDPSSYENGDVSMTSLQNYGIIMLFLVSLYFYSKDKRSWLVPAVIFQFLCIFSSGNGILGAFIIAVFTLFSRDKWKMITSFAVLLVFAPLYFYHYITPPPLPGPKVVTSFASEILYFFKMTGAHFSFVYPVYYGILVVAVLAICVPYDKKTLFNKQSLPLVCLLGFLIVTEGIIALIRSGTQVFNGSRYLIYPHLLAAIAFLFLFRAIMNRNILWPIIFAFSGMVYVYSNNYRFGQSGFERESLRAETMDYYYPNKVRAKIVAANACKTGIYCADDK
jgi:hypothetical protein